MRNIWSKLPLKMRKIIKRSVRVTAWLIAILVSVHHIDAAATEALRTKISSEELHVLRDLRMCVMDATADVGTILTDGMTSTSVGLAAFGLHFWQNWWAALVVLFAVSETFGYTRKIWRWTRAIISRWRKK